MKYPRAQYIEQLQATQKQSIDLVTQSIAKRSSITRSQMEEPDDSTFGERAADAVARFGGSWTFIIVFGLVLAAWVGTNSWLLTHNGHKAFDPYPYILLNLFLSMLASVQAPLILMSQNRQSEIDRENVQNDYEVNLKAELEIMALHEKVDALAEQHKEQRKLLQQLASTNSLTTQLIKIGDRPPFNAESGTHHLFGVVGGLSPISTKMVVCPRF